MVLISDGWLSVNALSAAALVDTDTAVYGAAALKRRSTAPGFGRKGSTTEMVFGERALLAFVPEIRQLRLRCGQQFDLATDPQHFIVMNMGNHKRVAAVLIRRDLELEACLLFFEHCVFGMGLGLMRGGDAVGDNCVIGPEAFLVQYVHMAAQALLRHRRIHGLSLTIRACVDRCAEVMGSADEYRMLTHREPRSRLKLADTYDAMLAGMGPRTRRSLAGKRRRLEQEAHVIFLPALEPSGALEAMLTLRLKSWPERTTRFCHARYRLLCERSELFSMGMRLPDGTWLSLLTGWRLNGVTFIDFQMNDMCFKKESISAVMRAFLMEHEIARQQEMISFVGGCSALLKRYCEPADFCTDIVLSRPCLRSAVLRAVLPFIKPDSRYERVLQRFLV